MSQVAREPHDRKAGNWRLVESVVDRPVPAHLSDVEAAGGDDGDRPHFGVGDNVDVPVIELGLTQVDDQSAHPNVDLGETAHLPATALPARSPRLLCCQAGGRRQATPKPLPQPTFPGLTGVTVRVGQNHELQRQGPPAPQLVERTTEEGVNSLRS